MREEDLKKKAPTGITGLKYAKYSNISERFASQILTFDGLDACVS